MLKYILSVCGLLVASVLILVGWVQLLNEACFPVNPFDMDPMGYIFCGNLENVGIPTAYSNRTLELYQVYCSDGFKFLNETFSIFEEWNFTRSGDTVWRKDLEVFNLQLLEYCKVRLRSSEGVAFTVYPSIYPEKTTWMMSFSGSPVVAEVSEFRKAMENQLQRTVGCRAKCLSFDITVTQKFKWSVSRNEIEQTISSFLDPSKCTDLRCIYESELQD